MRSIRFTSALICILLAFTLLCPLPVISAGDEKGEIPYADKPDTASSPYRYKRMDVYSSDEAAKAGVPEGYGGYVMKLTGDSSSGITVDFSNRNIPVTSVKALHFRVYYGKHTKEVRVTTDAGVSWVLRYNAVKPDQWDEIVLSDANEIKKLSGKNAAVYVISGLVLPLLPLNFIALSLLTKASGKRK